MCCTIKAGGYKFHPTCARCSRCGEHFGDGQEMYMQGDEIWHPRCEHAKVTENIAVSYLALAFINHSVIKSRGDNTQSLLTTFLSEFLWENL